MDMEGGVEGTEDSASSSREERLGERNLCLEVDVVARLDSGSRIDRVDRERH